MTRSLQIAAIQTAAHDRPTLGQVWPSIRERVRAAGKAGAKIVVLPEGTLPAYVLGYARYDASEIREALEDCKTLARALKLVLVVGAARVNEGHTYNSAIVFENDGSIAGAADKHFLWHFDRQWFTSGERIDPIRTSVASLGVLVCADGRIPTIARTLVDRGAEILIMPTAWVTSGRDPAVLENIQADLLARVRARENGVPFVAANKCGVELECVAYCGKSQIVAADGSVVAIASQGSEETIVGSVELGAGPPARKDLRAFSIVPASSTRRAPVRIAIAAREFSVEAFMEERLRILEAQLLVMPGATYPIAGNEDAPFVFVDDENVLDPGALAAHRLAGVDFVVWNTELKDPWQTAFARARALELRMYVAVVARNDRAYAVDPDGAILCGTFDGYEIASFTYDPERTKQTMVAPGTDVRAGLERAYDHATS